MITNHEILLDRARVVLFDLHQEGHIHFSWCYGINSYIERAAELGHTLFGVRRFFMRLAARDAWQTRRTSPFCA